jgi:cell division protein FtsI (penicillin-binding protein 3)
VTPSASSAKIADVKREGDPADATLALMRPSPQPAAPPTPPASAAPGAAPPGTVRVPDASGLAGHDVVTALTKVGLVPQIEGWGRVVRQNPPPGTAAPKGSAVRVVLEPAS